MLSRRIDGPNLEHDLMRHPSLGFEPLEDCGLVRCIEHGFPTPLARWHYHDEYEIQLILESRGQAFVGDYVGNFEPDHLVLTGPRLPHNWITTQSTSRAGPVDRLVIQFRDAPLRRALDNVPELAELEHLLSRAGHGIQFFDLARQARDSFYRIRNSRGTKRFAEFLCLLSELAASREYRLLSTSPIVINDSNQSSERLNRVIQFVHDHYMEPMDMQVVYELAGVSQSTFARTFSKATGMSFTAFVNRARITKAAELLMHSNLYIAKIAYEVGFHNLANFNRQFAGVKKMTPSEFRRTALLRLGRSVPDET
jgi:AraC-like DNA-binding protein